MSRNMTGKVLIVFIIGSLLGESVSLFGTFCSVLALLHQEAKASKPRFIDGISSRRDWQALEFRRVAPKSPFPNAIVKAARTAVCSLRDTPPFLGITLGIA
jgi:hypothetical protein